MRFLRYKTLSQFIDTENLYKNMTVLSEVFLLNDDYVVFLKRLDTNEIYYVKETFAGGFEVIKIPLNTWGVTITEWTLMKCYLFRKLGVNYMTFKISTNQYFTLFENDSGQTAVFVDTADDTKAMNLFRSACPLTTTKEDQNQTIHSFNDKQDGSNSSIIYNNNIVWDDWTDQLTAPKLNDVLTTNNFSKLSFNLLINDTAGTALMYIYDVIGGVLQPYVYDLGALQSALFNQIKNGEFTTARTFTLTTLSDYLALDFTTDQILVIATNNSLIYYDPNTGQYKYKNFLAYYTDSDFTIVQAFQTPELRYNMFKQILHTFHDVTDVREMKMSRLVLDSNMFMKADSNIGIVTDVIYKESAIYFDEAQSSVDILVPSDIPITTAMIPQNYTIDSAY